MVYSFHLSLSAGAGGANKRPRKHLTCTSQEETTWETKLTVANTERRQRQSSRLTQAMQRKRQLQATVNKPTRGYLQSLLLSLLYI